MTVESMQVNDDVNRLVTVKSRGKHKLYIAITVGVAVLALIALVIFIAIENAETSEKTGGQCRGAHESYGVRSGPELRSYSRFAVAVDDPKCSTIGKNFLEQGGSAVDAAIGAGLCNSVMNVQSMGIGGGHFMNIYIKSLNRSYLIDARETAPMNSHRDMFVKHPHKSLVGGLATAIPGELYGYYKAHQLAGRLPWRELFKPTIKLCEDGFPISLALAETLRIRENFVRNNTALREWFINPATNSIYKKGDIIKCPKLAATFREISENGYETFYRGSLAAKIVKEINQNGGNVTLEDFRRYEPRVYQDRLIVRLDNNLRMYVAPPPSSSVLIPAILRIVKAFGLEEKSKMSNEMLNKFYHRLIETFKHAYGKRMSLGDEAFVNVSQIVRELGGQKYIDEIVGKINDQKTFPTSYYGVGLKDRESGTAHISVLAPNGDAVSLTSSINNHFGAKYMGEQTGIIYSDTMDDFSTPGLVNSFGLAPSEANFIAPGKRPLSSMSPIIVVDNNNQVRLVLGASGGAKIVSAVAQVAIKTLWMGMDLKSAIDERRAHHQLLPTYAQLEEGFPNSITASLKAIGHETICFAFGGSTVQGIHVVNNNTIYAYSDPRKGGEADGV